MDETLGKTAAKSESGRVGGPTEKTLAKEIVIGTAYYPEHWPRERWSQDLELMKEHGIKVLRLAELAWALLEPRDGEFDFAWLDEFIAMAYARGLRVVLGTPIEASPVWLRHQHPEVVRKDNMGHIHGGRGMHCHNNRTFAFYVSRIVREMAKRYGQNPAVIGWQIDNELRAVECYCEACAQDFREWLRDRYGSLEALNEAWGTRFWSQVYHDWDEVRLPSADQLTVSVSQKLDYLRFCSHSTIEHVKRQVDIIKEHAPHQFVTHNTLGGFFYNRLNNFELARHLDFISWDSYPAVDSDNVDTCIGHDLHRSASRAPFWVMEQKNGYFNYSDYNLAITPGLVRLWTYQDIARGANGVMYYRWRSNRFSWEQNPNGLLRHDGTPRRALEEVGRLTKELESFGSELAETRVDAPVAIVYSYDVEWSFEAHKQYRHADYREQILAYYRALLRMGITPDLVDPNRDLSRYDVVIAPSLTMVSEGIAQNLESYVKQGGCLLLTGRSGIKDWANVTIDAPWPGLLRELTGVVIDEFEVLPPRLSNGIRFDGKEYRVTGWLDMLTPTTAESLAVYTEKFYAGRTAIARNRLGRGVVYYVGVMGGADLVRAVLGRVAKETGRLHDAELPEGVFLSRRVKEGVVYHFYVNMSDEPRRVRLLKEGVDVLTGEAVQGEAEVGGIDVLIVRSGK